MTINFYNKVAKKFGGYYTDVKYSTEYLNGAPEKIFREKLINLSGEDKTVLDVGCADGRFTLSVASYFRRTIAIDLSTVMLDIARKNQKKQANKNISFEKQNADNTNYSDGFFDVVYSRRGPTPFIEFYRLLRRGGYFVGINIGEKDCIEIKRIFNRGQEFSQRGRSRLEADEQELEKAGFKTVFAKEYFYNEYYTSYKDLDIFLHGVPIFEDFDSEKDRKYLEEYVMKFKTEKGIKFPRHRVVIVAKKF